MTLGMLVARPARPGTRKVSAIPRGTRTRTRTTLEHPLRAIKRQRDSGPGVPEKRQLSVVKGMKSLTGITSALENHPDHHRDKKNHHPSCHHPSRSCDANHQWHASVRQQAPFRARTERAVFHNPHYPQRSPAKNGSARVDLSGKQARMVCYPSPTGVQPLHTFAVPPDGRKSGAQGGHTGHIDQYGIGKPGAMPEVGGAAVKQAALYTPPAFSRWAPRDVCRTLSETRVFPGYIETGSDSVADIDLPKTL